MGGVDGTVLGGQREGARTGLVEQRNKGRWRLTNGTWRGDEVAVVDIPVRLEEQGPWQAACTSHAGCGGGRAIKRAQDRRLGGQTHCHSGGLWLTAVAACPPACLPTNLPGSRRLDEHDKEGATEGAGGGSGRAAACSGAASNTRRTCLNETRRPSDSAACHTLPVPPTLSSSETPSPAVCPLQEQSPPSLSRPALPPSCPPQPPQVPQAGPQAPFVTCRRACSTSPPLPTSQASIPSLPYPAPNRPRYISPSPMSTMHPNLEHPHNELDLT